MRIEGDQRHLFGQGRPMAKDSSGSGSAWATGTVSRYTGASGYNVESRLMFEGTVAATDMSRATDAREKDRIGIFGTGLSYAGSYGRVTSESIGRDLNPLGRGDGTAYIAGTMSVGSICPSQPISSDSMIMLRDIFDAGIIEILSHISVITHEEMRDLFMTGMAYRGQGLGNGINNSGCSGTGGGGNYKISPPHPDMELSPGGNYYNRNCINKWNDSTCAKTSICLVLCSCAGCNLCSVDDWKDHPTLCVDRHCECMRSCSITGKCKYPYGLCTDHATGKSVSCGPPDNCFDCGIVLQAVAILLLWKQFNTLP